MILEAPAQTSIKEGNPIQLREWSKAHINRELGKIAEKRGDYEDQSAEALQAKQKILEEIYDYLNLPILESGISPGQYENLLFLFEGVSRDDFFRADTTGRSPDGGTAIIKGPYQDVLDRIFDEEKTAEAKKEILKSLELYKEAVRSQLAAEIAARNAEKKAAQNLGTLRSRQ
jgi:hypothetical protein